MSILMQTLLVATIGSALPVERTDQSCLEPAMPLMQLIGAYDRWPAPPKGDERSFDLFRKYIRTHSAADHGRALNSYHFAAGNQDEMRNPHLLLVLGLLNVGGPDFDFPGADGYRHSRTRYNTNAERLGARHLERLLEGDSSHWIAAVALTRIAIGSRASERFRQAKWAVQRALQADSTLVAMHLAWHDLLVAEGHYDEAVAYLKTYSSNCAAVQHARAESLMLTGDTVLGPRMYIAALKNAEPQELDRFYEDMQVMAKPAEREQYNALPAGRRSAWLLAYWDRNAAQYGRNLETRIAEHIVRVTFADANFKRDRVQSVPGAGDVPRGTAMDDFIADSSLAFPWDIRGVLHVRHGAPVYRLKNGTMCGGSEAWAYLFDGDPTVLEFRRTCGPHDWIVKLRPGCSADFLGAEPDPAIAFAKAEQSPFDMDMREMYQVLARFDERYGTIIPLCQIVAAGGTSLELPRITQLISLERQKVLKKLEWTESAFIQFRHPLRMVLATYSFRGSDNAAEVAILSWFGVGDLPDAGRNGAAMRYGFSILTPAREPIREVQTIEIPATKDTAAVIQHVYTWRPGDVASATINVVGRVPSDTSYGATRTLNIDVPAARTGQLGLSDLVLAEAGESGPLVRGAAHLAPLPFHNVRTGESFRLFFELYGLQPGDGYTTVIRLKRTERTGISELRKLFPDRDAERTITTADNVRIDARGIAIHDVDVTSDLLPGKYDVEVRITSTKGSATARTRLEIESRKDP